MNVVNSLSDGTPNWEVFDMNKSSINPKDPSNLSAPNISPPKNAYERLQAQGLYSRYYGIIFFSQFVS